MPDYVPEVDLSVPMDTPPDPKNTLFPFEFLKYDNKLVKLPKVPFILEVLQNYFTIIERVFNPQERVTDRIEIPVLKTDARYIYIPIPFCDAVYHVITNSGYLLDYKSVPNLDSVEGEFDIDDSWYDFFRADQIENLEAIIAHPHGVAQLPTGYGKTEFIMAIAHAYKGSGNVLILVPNNGIREEIMFRAAEKNIQVSQGIDPKTKICVINPVGYCSSKASELQANIDWFGNVDLVLIDESDNINDSTMKVLNWSTKYKHIIGFSATPDKFDGKLLRTNDLRQFTVAPYLVLKYIGPSIVYSKFTRSVIFNEFLGLYGTKRCPPKLDYLAYGISLRNVIYHEQFLDKELPYMVKNKNKILFIPVQCWKHAETIHAKLVQQGYHPVSWRSGYVNSSIPGIKSYTDIKNYARHQYEDDSITKIDVILATSVGFIGINIPEITDVYLYIGTQVKTVCQPAGRAFRGTHTPTIWCSKETRSGANDFFQRCTWRREAIIKKSYKIIYNEIRL